MRLSDRGEGYLWVVVAMSLGAAVDLCDVADSGHAHEIMGLSLQVVALIAASSAWLGWNVGNLLCAACLFGIALTEAGAQLLIRDQIGPSILNWLIIVLRAGICIVPILFYRHDQLRRHASPSEGVGC